MKKILFFIGIALFSANLATLKATEKSSSEEISSKISQLSSDIEKRKAEILVIQEQPDYKNKQNGYLNSEMTLCYLELSNYQDEQKVKELQELQVTWGNTQHHKDLDEHINTIINKYTARDYSYVY